MIDKSMITIMFMIIIMILIPGRPAMHAQA